MKFYFCETCGKRVTDSDLDSGAGRSKKLAGTYCRSCAVGVNTIEFDAINIEPPAEPATLSPPKSSTVFLPKPPTRELKRPRSTDRRFAATDETDGANETKRSPPKNNVVMIAGAALGVGLLLGAVIIASNRTRTVANSEKKRESNSPAPKTNSPTPSADPVAQAVVANVKNKEPLTEERATGAVRPAAQTSTEDQAQAAFEVLARRIEKLAPGDAERTRICDEFLSSYSDTIVASRVRLLQKAAAPTTATIEAKSAPPETKVVAAADVAADPAGQNLAAKLKEVNPGFDGKLEAEVSGGNVVGLKLSVGKITDLGPLHGLTGLTKLTCLGGDGCKLADLTPLAGLPLKELGIDGTAVTDLSPLAGMPLEVLNASNTKIASLAPLKDMKLKHFFIANTPIHDLSALKGQPIVRMNLCCAKVTDLSALSGMPLDYLSVACSPISDLSPLRGLKLKEFDVFGTEQVSDLSPLTGMPLERLNCCWAKKIMSLAPLKNMPLKYLKCDVTGVTDFSPLRDLPLQTMECTLDPKRDRDALLSIKSLQSLNGASPAAALAVKP